MYTFTLRLPSSLHKGINQLAEREGVSMNQIITTAVAEKLSALMTEDYLAPLAPRRPGGLPRGVPAQPAAGLLPLPG